MPINKKNKENYTNIILEILHCILLRD